MSSSYESAIALIEAAGGGDFEGEKPDSLVAKGEAALGLTFPPSYRRFLQEFGCGSVNGFEVYGLIDDNFADSAIPNAIWLTLTERAECGLDPGFVIVGEGGDGVYLAIDTRVVDGAGESPVARISPDSREYERIAASFGDFLLEEIKAIL